MKTDIHPTNYRPVIFRDTSSGDDFIISSTAETKETATVDGVEYPLIKVHISSSSHPFYTGKEKVMDIEGRVDRFKAKAKKAEAARKQKAKQASKQSEDDNSDDSDESEVTKIGDPQANK
jgi:large subunit ribosomal protein L31